MQNRLRAKFVQGDVMALPFAAGSFDLIFSIGLLEYIVNCQTTLQEQARALAPGGLLVAYVVPYYQQNIQHNYRWINKILKGYHNFFSHPSGEAMAPPPPKNDVASASFVRTFGKVGLTGVEASGAYPLPLISHAPEFPFSLMAPESEQAVVRHFREILDQRRSQHPSRHPWLCEEGYGQAFYVWGYKPK